MQQLICGRSRTVTNKRALTSDAADPVETILHRDANQIHIERTQDVEPILKQNKARRMAGTKANTSKSGDLRHVASIPLTVVEQWMKEGIDPLNPDHADKVAAKLNDPQNAFLRTGGGRV